MTSKMWMGSWVALGIVGALAVGCGGDAESFEPRGDGDVGTRARGEACAENFECRGALVCAEGACEYQAGSVDEGGECVVSIECVEGTFCDRVSSTCQPVGQATEGAQCDGDAACAAGLVCQPRGLGTTCQPVGQGDVGQSCATTGDCLSGLTCAVDPLSNERACRPGVPLPTPFAGVDCSRSDEDDGPLRFYFELPGGEDPSGEYFRLPFPSDVRLNGRGRPDLEGFPTPGPGVIGFDIVQTYVDALERDGRGWGTNQTIYVRSSGTLQLDTLKARGDDRTMYLVDITPDSPGYDQTAPVSWVARGGGGSKRRYICQNWVAVRPFWGRPLRPATTYALVVESGVRGAPPEGSEQGPLVDARDADFEQMLAEERPGDRASAVAWDRHAPLREWIAASEEVDAPEDVLVAAVFTTDDPLAQTSKLREVVRGSQIEASDLTLCEEGVSSPCDDGLEGGAHTRGCFGSQSDFAEIQGRLSLPILQQGEAPYLEEGGAIAEQPEVERIEQACMSMTVPQRAEMPEAGWPVLIYAHGTGGDYRNQVRQIAPLVSQIELPDGSTTGVLTLGWDQVLHFDRRNGSELEPEPLVFNYANPQAARGNFMQGGAEVHALVKFVEELELSAQDSPTGQAIKADPSQIYFMGHSQGGTTGPLALPFEPGVRAAILSGAGGGLTLGLLNKTSPVDSPTALKVALQDPDVGEVHPALALVQAYFEVVDPINYGPYLGDRQREGVTEGKHIFHIYGLGDTYTPPAALRALGRALYATYLGPLLEEFGGGISVAEEGERVSANRKIGETFYTVVGRQYAPPGGEEPEYDGHFVTFRDEQAQLDLIQFLATAIGQQRPALGPPTEEGQ